jgi:hypothetical protein
MEIQQSFRALGSLMSTYMLTKGELTLINTMLVTFTSNISIYLKCKKEHSHSNNILSTWDQSIDTCIVFNTEAHSLIRKVSIERARLKTL